MKRFAFLGTSGSLVASGITAVQAQSPLVPGGTHFVEAKADFDEMLFEQTIGRPAEIRQLFEAVSFHPQMFGNVRNTLNGLVFGFGYASERVAVAICPHGQSSSYCFSDYVWQKYEIGEAFNLKDAKESLVTSNIYMKPDHVLSNSGDPSDEQGFFQDTSIETLQKRGVVFTTCHTAVEEQARNLVKGGFAPARMTARDVANDILTHLFPGSVVVPSMVGAIAVMQARYKYTYVTLTY